jgi:hypothetical protein
VASLVGFFDQYLESNIEADDEMAQGRRLLFGSGTVELQHQGTASCSGDMQFDTSLDASTYTPDGLRKAGILPGSHPDNHLKLQFCPGGNAACPNKKSANSHMFALKITRATDGRTDGQLVAGYGSMKGSNFVDCTGRSAFDYDSILRGAVSELRFAIASTA